MSNNPIIQGMEINTMNQNMDQVVNQLKQIMVTARGFQNPNMYVMQMIKQNPKYGPVIQVLQRYNGDSMKAFREIASQNGLNPDDILKRYNNFKL